MGRIWRQRIRGAWATLVARRRDRQRRILGVGQADISRRQSDWAAAIEGYRAYLGRRPRDLGVRIRLIRTLYSAGRLDEAEVLLNESLRVRSDKAELAAIAEAIRSARAASVPVDNYDLFRGGTALPEPPFLEAPDEIVVVVVDARDRSARAVELTLDSVLRSQIPAGSVVVWSDSQAEIDDPIATTGLVLMLEAGVALDPEAMGWLIHGVRTTGAVAAYGDDDAVVNDGGVATWSDPAFYPAPHPLDLATIPRLPAAVLFRAEALSRLQETRGARPRLIEAFGAGSVAHVPLVLATRREMADNDAVQPDGVSGQVPDGRILTIIPTRDEGEALRVMIESLEAKAAQPAQLEILVVDNGSRDPHTLALLDGLAGEGRIRVLPVDEPFNWSRLNNLAAAGSDAEVLLFANNDMQMITDGWDDRLRLDLLQPGVGVVGARLIYPNGRVQHGGMALGALNGKPVHEGLGTTRAEGGPLDRWRRTRPAAAVTGAFMAVRREAFAQAGGFNALEFAVGCNDIDFCLRVRERGWTVLYAADLELIHRESHSRGHDDTDERMRRVRGELEALSRIWGGEAVRDPGRNPHWVNHETLLYHGVRQPSVEEVEAWVRRSVDLWRVERPSGSAGRSEA